MDTEKLLMSNDKVTITDLWKSSPQPTFPAFFLKLFDLDFMLAEAQKKVDSLQTKIDKSKLEKRRKEEAKADKTNKMREEQMEMRRQRMEQQERKKLEQRKFAEELKRRADLNQ